MCTNYLLRRRDLGKGDGIKDPNITLTCRFEQRAYKGTFEPRIAERGAFFGAP